MGMLLASILDQFGGASRLHPRSSPSTSKLPPKSTAHFSFFVAMRAAERFEVFFLSHAFYPTLAVCSVAAEARHADF